MQTATPCKRQGCPNTVTSLPKFRKREYCSDVCRQKAYRKRSGQLTGKFRQLKDRINDLERQVEVLKTRLYVEERLQRDTQVRHFKAYLRRHPHPLDLNFYQRFLADPRLPQYASRALYEAKLRTYGYDTVDIHLFRDAWYAMLFEQS